MHGGPVPRLGEGCSPQRQHPAGAELHTPRGQPGELARQAARTRLAHHRGGVRPGGHPAGDLPPAKGRTVILLGHEFSGIPSDALHLLDEAVEIPMIGRGASLNVAVAGSLVLYRLAGPAWVRKVGV
ncbi:TrmH family RNA methyltransferase [Tsukamurella sp. NPDC003166]|uniref:TrmH family RNA methyltransferase n=1 Tax=Tsukamurella sp. NPDC003166 TaxID=3154444 RepID=UPI0033BC52D9